MVMTILEGRVAKENWHLLEQEFQQASQINEPGLVQSFLIQNERETDLWRILTVWESLEALQAMRKTQETPRGVLIFRHAHTEPVLGIFDIVQEINQQ